ncbi:ketosteroid isomerase-like protein [Agromyces ramosus]|jgi:ketosteroid isomerase-like protein|uniref:Ketosteroid isomerase-like protein n=1 Tax=Agromyces ramosus TaxID=33879 RepID=A0A4Q7MEF2_9MICO|nr:nuclear transport factor 2 family protein [Agromyces ramosus]RZS64749.1 ketosteroid isomerase-like protein [Agromyces ramosus]
MPRIEQYTETAVDSAEVAWLVSKRAAAIRARDAEYLASRYAPGALTFGAAPPLSAFAGEAQRVEWLRAWFERFRGRIEHRVLDLTVSVGDDLAFCHSRDVLSVRPVHGRRREVRFETTLGLRRVGGVWLVESERVGVTE